MSLLLRGSFIVLPALATIVVGLRLISPARADDCSPLKKAIMTAARTPHTSTMTRIMNGKPVTSHMIQTKDVRYFDIDGKWRSMPYSPEDVREVEEKLNNVTLTCTRVGSDSLDGKTVTVYSAHFKNDDVGADVKVWLSADGLPLRVDNKSEAGSYSSTNDFSHAEPPADFAPIGKK